MSKKELFFNWIIGLGVIGFLAFLYFKPEKPLPPPPPPPSTESIFNDAENERYGQFSDMGRFAPVSFQGKITILDTKFGNVWIYDFANKRWAKIKSPLATTNFCEAGFFDDLIPPPRFKDTDPLGIEKK